MAITSAARIPYVLKPLSSLPIPTIVGREYRAKAKGERATRGEIASISTWMDTSGGIFFTLHDSNRAREKTFELKLGEGTWHQESDDDIVLTMTSGLSFIFYARKTS